MSIEFFVTIIFGILILELFILFFLFMKNILFKNQEMNLLIIAKYTINLCTLAIPFIIYFKKDWTTLLWDLSLYAVFLVMCIRPLRDLLPRLGFARLMPLRKNLGIFSAMIVVLFGMFHYITLGSDFLPT